MLLTNSTSLLNFDLCASKVNHFYCKAAFEFKICHKNNAKFFNFKNIFIVMYHVLYEHKIN